MKKMNLKIFFENQKFQWQFKKCIECPKNIETHFNFYILCGPVFYYFIMINVNFKIVQNMVRSKIMFLKQSCHDFSKNITHFKHFFNA